VTQQDKLQNVIREISYESHQDLAQQIIDQGWVLIPADSADYAEFMSEAEGLSSEQVSRVQSLINYVVETEKTKAAATPSKLSAYKVGDAVDIMVNGDWYPGIVTSFSQLNTNIHVGTERGPHTLQNKARIRPRV
jgi:hypothetical protein